MASCLWSAVCLMNLMMVSTRSVQINNGQELFDLNRAIRSVEKLLEFYRLNVRNFNMDGFFGLRVLEGQLMGILKDQKSKQHKDIPEYILQQLSKLAKLATALSNDGFTFVRKDNPEYFDDFISIVNVSWRDFKESRRRVDPDLRWEIPQYKVDANFLEPDSNRCILEILHPVSNFCNVSESCLKIMTTRGSTGYASTHQILWSILAERSPLCKKAVEVALPSVGMKSIEAMQLEMCTNIFYETMAVVHVLMKGKVHESYQDLFLEQQFVCLDLGFFEFLKRDYLNQIFSWQFPSGCFGDIEESNVELFDVKKLLGSYHKLYNKGNVNKIHRRKSSDRDVLTGAASHNRKLLAEKDLPGGCLSHKTGVAACALIMYLRYLIKPAGIKWDGPHELFEMDRMKMLHFNNESRANQMENKKNNMGSMSKFETIRLERLNTKFPGSGNDNKYADKVRYSQEDEQKLLVFLVFLTPTLIAIFYIFKVFRRFRIASILYNRYRIGISHLRSS